MSSASSPRPRHRLIHSIRLILAGILVVLLTMVITLLVGLTIAQYADPNTYRSFPHKCHEYSLSDGPQWESSWGVSLKPPGTYCTRHNIETGDTIKIEPSRAMSMAFGASWGAGLVALGLVLRGNRRHQGAKDESRMQLARRGAFVVWIGAGINTALAVLFGLDDFDLYVNVMFSTSAVLGLAAGIVAKKGSGAWSLTIATTLSLLAALTLVAAPIFAILFLVAALLFAVAVTKSLRSTRAQPS